MSLQEIEDLMLIEYSVECQRCGNVSRNQDIGDASYASEYFHDDGWRVEEGVLLCPWCAKKSGDE